MTDCAINRSQNIPLKEIIGFGHQSVRKKTQDAFRLYDHVCTHSDTQSLADRWLLWDMGVGLLDSTSSWRSDMYLLLFSVIKNTLVRTNALPIESQRELEAVKNGCKGQIDERQYQFQRNPGNNGKNEWIQRTGEIHTRGINIFRFSRGR